MTSQHQPDPDQTIQQELSRLGLGREVEVSRQRSRRRPDGEVEWYDHPTEVDLSPGESYVRGRPEEILPVLRSLKPGTSWEDLTETMDRAGIRVDVYPCSWEMGEDEWVDDEEDGEGDQSGHGPF